MTIHANPKELFEWLNTVTARYAVLRDINNISQALSHKTMVRDIDLLIDDIWIPKLRANFRQKRGLTKIDLYGLHGQFGSDYHCFPHLPESLGERALSNRRYLTYGFYGTQPQEELDSLLYHLTYHKNLQSQIAPMNEALTKNTPAIDRIKELCDELAIKRLSLNHQSFHDYLTSRDLAITENRLIYYIQNDFRHGRKVFFHAWLQNQQPGEMNLFVIRAVAVKKGHADSLLKKLAGLYEIVAVKPIDWWTRYRTRTRMRGGKWRRGGLPHIAVVVFDRNPNPTNETDRMTHPYVFNRTQFEKVEWRKWFMKTAGVSEKDNPIHSTDNEAEAIGHLPLFFDLKEQKRIFTQLHKLREGLVREKH